tara:strand:- start:56 stop:238 length:183 start_codon:yes stop_codon:yes gene_type:complete
VYYLGENMSEYEIKAYTINGEYINWGCDGLYEVNQFFYEVGEGLTWCVILKWGKFHYRAI